MFIKEKQGFKYPFQTTKNGIPLADLADNQTTISLVAEDEKDSFFFRSLEKQGIYLNNSQLQAVRTTDGPVLIIAGAGSGKTRVLTCRTAYLLTFKDDLKPEEVLLVSFTRKAATEMLERIKLLPGLSTSIANRIVSGTFHSIFLRLLRSHNYRADILSNSKYQEILMTQILRDLSLVDSYEPESLLSLISHYKSQMILPRHLEVTTPIEKEIQRIYMAYEQLKEKKNLMDFDDILLETYYLLKYNHEVREQLQNRFKYICIDEYQDTNLVQHEIMRLLLNKSQNLLAVGDEDQSIYNFRSSSPEFILNLKKEFPNLTQITLDTNYRSTIAIVGLGNDLIKHNTKRIGKVLKATKEAETTPIYLRPKDSDHEAKLIVDNIVADTQNGNRRFKDYTILYRIHSLGRAIWDELVQREVPFVAHGVKQVFYQNHIVKPVLDHLRLSLDPNNLDAISGIAPSMYLSREKVSQHITSNSMEQKTANNLLLLLRFPGLKPYHQGEILNRVEHIRNLKNMAPKEAIKFIRKGPVKYDEFLNMDDRKTITLHKEFLIETLDELESASEKFTRVEDFIHFIDTIIEKHRDMEDLKKNPNADAVQLMTLHSAKGLEFPCVFIIGFCEGIMPHKAIENAEDQKDRVNANTYAEALEEERRLAYVGVTRAEEELFISSPKKYRGKNVEISRFLKESFQEK
ncbi:ATP-dependent helicase [Cytobacillus firmus]|uniref:ATP-dependent helicase n=1 Tax=Cytobacillus firmus TaxID=1399 RepID=UPI0036CBAAF7